MFGFQPKYWLGHHRYYTFVQSKIKPASRYPKDYSPSFEHKITGVELAAIALVPNKRFTHLFSTYVVSVIRKSRVRLVPASRARQAVVLPLEPLYRSGHPENELLFVIRKHVFRLELSRKDSFNFGSEITGRQYILAMRACTEDREFTSLKGRNTVSCISAVDFNASENRLTLHWYLRHSTYAAFKQAILCWHTKSATSETWHSTSPTHIVQHDQRHYFIFSGNISQIAPPIIYFHHLTEYY